MHQLFHSLDSFLAEHAHFWRFEPFHASVDNQRLWMDHAKHTPDAYVTSDALNQWLDELSINDIEGFKDSTASLITALTPFIPDLKSMHETMSLSITQVCDQIATPPYILNGISGRKLEQIQSMSHFLLQHHKGNEWLEWCSGKGFLGRILAYQSHQKVTSFEYQHTLCEKGQLIANQLQLPMTFIQGDAFSSSAKQVFNQQHAVALHACGDLHAKLLEYGVAHSLPAITFSPCCYHLIKADHYQPLSLVGKSASLILNRAELRIPLHQTVTGGERVKRHRRQEMVYRLAFDLLIKEAGYGDGYCTIPSIQKSQLSLGFGFFCQWAIEQKNLSLKSVDFSHSNLAAYEKRGEARFWRMEAMNLVQDAFRRLLEKWLVLDKAIYLQESGYNVTITRFCPRSMTPRNILVHAWR